LFLATLFAVGMMGQVAMAQVGVGDAGVPAIGPASAEYLAEGLAG
ncbi:MAG: hypothetical protein IH919_11460, partial [Deltaproteobacteria bacterium]|nr:hypothetical protein [Deltaproteobacteria bacterium]